MLKETQRVGDRARPKGSRGLPRLCERPRGPSPRRACPAWPRPRPRSRQPRPAFPACNAGRAAGPSGGPHGAARGGGPDSLEPGAGRAPLPACRAQVWPRRGRGCAFLPARPFLPHPGRMQPPPAAPQPPPLTAQPGTEEGARALGERGGRECKAPPASGTRAL